MVKAIENFNNKGRVNCNCKEFYSKHPDLAPRNVYLSMGRVLDKTKVDRFIENFDKPFWVRAKNWCKYKIQDIFSKNKV